MPEHQTGDTEIVPTDVTQCGQWCGLRWTSWQLWLGGLLFALGTVVVVLAIPFVRRAQALEYFDNNGVAYNFWGDDQWITDRFGDWAMPFRNITNIVVDAPSRRTWTHVAQFSELEELAIDVSTITWDTVNVLKQMPNIEVLLYCCDYHIRDENLRREVETNWTLRSDCDCDPIPEDW